MEQTTQRKRFRNTINMLDKFYLAVNEAANPVIFLIDFDVEGEMSFETFLTACLATFRRIPLMKSVIRGKEGWFRRLWWEELDIDGTELVEYLDYYQNGKLTGQESMALHQEAFHKYSIAKWDIRDEPPIKIKLIRKGEASWSIFYMIHHAGVDVLGIYGFVQLLIENYMLISLGRPPQEEPVKQVRNIYMKLLLKTPPWKLLSILIAFFRYERFNHPRVMTPFLEEWKEREGTVRTLDLVIEEPLARKVTERIRKLGISLNEAIILASARNVYQWIQAQGRSAEKISVAVPVNMRSYAKVPPIESVSNCSITMNINLPTSLFEKTAELIEIIRLQSHGLKHLGLPLIGIIQTALLCWLPLRLLKKIMAKAIESGTVVRSTPTLVCSNPGLLFTDKEGNPFLVPMGTKSVVAMINYSFPVAYPLAVAMIAIGYGGKIKISLSYLESVLERKTMEEFLAGFQQLFFSVLDEKSLMKEPLPPFMDLIADLEQPQIVATPHSLVR